MARVMEVETAREKLPQTEVNEVALIELVQASLRGVGFISAETVTQVRLTGEGRQVLGNVTKVAKVNVTLNADYQSAVNRKRQKEGLPKDFIAGPRTNGTRPINGLPFSVGNPKNDDGKPHLYMDIMFPRSSEYTYFDEAGNVLAHETVNPYIYRSPNQSRQGVQDEVLFRTYDVQNLRGLTINGIKV